MSSSCKYYRTAPPSYMTKEDIEDAEHINSYAFINCLAKSEHCIPSWSMHYDPEQPSDNEEDLYVPLPSTKKVAKQVKPPVSNNRFAILAKLAENATAMTSMQTKTSHSQKRK